MFCTGLGLQRPEAHTTSQEGFYAKTYLCQQRLEGSQRKGFLRSRLARLARVSSVSVTLLVTGAASPSCFVVVLTVVFPGLRYNMGFMCSHFGAQLWPPVSPGAAQ